MVKLTFKQFMTENQNFVSSTMDMMPDKYEYVDDPKNPGQKIKVETEKYKKFRTQPAAFPVDQDKLKVEIDKPEETEFNPQEIPKTVVSGGRAKESAIKRAGQAYNNDYFYGRSDFFRPGPDMYTPSIMPVETQGRR